MITENKNKLANFEVTVTSLEKTIGLQQQRLSNLEDRERRNNMIVFGISEANNETAADWERKVIRDIFFGRLGVTVTSVERIHRLGPKRHDETIKTDPSSSGYIITTKSIWCSRTARN